jgi:hypothetical protein
MRLLWGLLACTSLCLSAAERPDPPDEAAQKAALKTIKEVFQSDYAKTKLEDRATFGQKLLAQFDDSKDDAATRYALLTECIAVASKAGDIYTALSAISRIGEWNVDETVLKRSALTAAEGVVANFETKKFVTNLKVLLDKPDDPTANLSVGYHYCLVRGNWDAGLPNLLKGSDPVLKALAEKEIAKPEESAGQAALGDEWWDFAQKQSVKEVKQSALERAKHWYEPALAGLAGLAKSKVEKRIDGIKYTGPVSPKAVDPAVNSALQWLAQHQEADGHWDTMKYESGNKSDTACTGFALLAFSRAGNTEDSGPFKDNVKRAIGWLRSKQDNAGLVFDKTDAGAHRAIGYPHAIAGIALAEAANGSKHPETIGAAQKAIDYSLKVQEDPVAGGFRYQPKSAGCISVSGWYFQQMAAAKASGLTISPAAFNLATKFLDTLAFKNATGITEYNYQPTKEANTNKRRSSIGAAARLLFGAKKEDVLPTIEEVIKTGGLPAWGANGESVDLYYWHYGTLATSLAGGEVSRKWNGTLKSVLIEKQSKQGLEAGSWPPAGEFSAEWGRVGQTALSCISLIIATR